MDRRVLAAVVALALIAATLLAMLMMPSVDGAAPAPRPDEGVQQPATPGGVAAVKPAERPAHAPIPVGSKGQSTPAQANAPVALGGPSPLQAMPAEVLETNPEYKCRAMGQQADLIDKLIVISNGGAVDDEQRKTMVLRVAQMSTRVFDAGESLWKGDLSCEGISDVNLGHAAEFLARSMDDLDLADNDLVEVEQALGLLDTVEWPEGEEN